jgi:MoaA/NifB/PqqE/SkfB family radical SAM enzyme
MPVSAKQAAAVGSYIFKQKLKGNKKYPLVVMLDPLYRCNLACFGCGKIQFPDEILKQSMPKEKAWAAADECGAPMVNIAEASPSFIPR